MIEVFSFFLVSESGKFHCIRKTIQTLIIAYSGISSDIYTCGVGYCLFYARAFQSLDTNRLTTPHFFFIKHHTAQESLCGELVMKSFYRALTALLILILCPIGLLLSCTNEDYEIYSEIHVVVTDYDTGAKIENASVVLSPSSQTKTTDAEGSCIFENLDSQQYTLTVQRSGYQPNRKTVNAISGERIEITIPLTKIPQ